VKAVDTSVIIAAFASWHESHALARRALDEGPSLIVHCALETYSVLTRLPVPHRAPADLAAQFLAARFCGSRDNVIFELGLFIGALGREHTFMVYNRETPMELPSDLAGVTPATYGSRSDDNLAAALGVVCTQLKRAIKI
jgi:hypothetical protein